MDKIKTRISPDRDTCKDSVNDHKTYTLKGNAFKYTHGRPLPSETAQKAIKYIRVLVSKYPFQLRYAMALPYWQRFEEAWCDTGDESKALRAI